MSFDGFIQDMHQQKIISVGSVRENNLLIGKISN